MLMDKFAQTYVWNGNRLDHRGIAKLGDFGVSHIFEEELDVEDDLTPVDEESDLSVPGLTRQDTESYLSMSGMSNRGLLTRTEGTWCFWSPEMCQGSRSFSGYSADIWAAGVVFFSLCTGKLPFYSEVPTELFEQIIEGEVPYAMHGLSNTLVDLLKGAMEKDPKKRAGVGDCLKVGVPRLLLCFPFPEFTAVSLFFLRLSASISPGCQRATNPRV